MRRQWWSAQAAAHPGCHKTMRAPRPLSSLCTTPRHLVPLLLLLYCNEEWQYMRRFRLCCRCVLPTLMRRSSAPDTRNGRSPPAQVVSDAQQEGTGCEMRQLWLCVGHMLSARELNPSICTSGCCPYNTGQPARCSRPPTPALMTAHTRVYMRAINPTCTAAAIHTPLCSSPSAHQ